MAVVDITNEIFGTRFKKNDIKNKGKHDDYHRKIQSEIEKTQGKEERLTLLKNKIVSKFPDNEQALWINRDQLRNEAAGDPGRLELLDKQLKLIHEKIECNESVRDETQAYEKYLNEKNDDIQKTPAEMMALKKIYREAVSDLNNDSCAIFRRMMEHDKLQRTPFESESKARDSMAVDRQIKIYIKEHGKTQSIGMEVENTSGVSPASSVVNSSLLEAILYDAKHAATSVSNLAQQIPTLSVSSTSNLSSTARIWQQLEEEAPKKSSSQQKTEEIKFDQTASALEKTTRKSSENDESSENDKPDFNDPSPTAGPKLK